MHLYKLDKNLKSFIAAFLLALTLGMMVGMIYLNTTTNMTIKGTQERWNGSSNETLMEFEIVENYPKPFSEMLVTTHTHVISFTLIFGIIGFIFNYSSVVGGFWKKFLMIEPLLSVVITFASIWAMRFIHESFVYVTILSATIMYTSYFMIVGMSIYELLFKSIEK